MIFKVACEPVHNNFCGPLSRNVWARLVQNPKSVTKQATEWKNENDDVTQTSTSKQHMIHAFYILLQRWHVFYQKHISIRSLGVLSGTVEVTGFLGFGAEWLDVWRPTFQDNCFLKTLGTLRPMIQHHVAEEGRLQRNKYGDKIFEIRVRKSRPSRLSD